MKTALIGIRTLIYMSGFLWLWGWLALSARGYDRRFGLGLPEWAQAPGALLMIAGAALALTCAVTFVARGRGTPALFDPPRRFVAAGPYKHVRNPMYIGGLALLAGFGLYMRSVAMLLLCLPAFLLVHLLVIGYEEPTLKSKFGAAYEHYLAVPRWIPRLR